MKDHKEQYIDSLFIAFDEMGFAPTTVCPDPEKYAIEWRENVRAEIKRLENENAALRERLDKAVELPLEHSDYHLEPMVARIVERVDSNKVDLRMPCYIYFEFDNEEEAENYLTKWQRGDI